MGQECDTIVVSCRVARKAKWYVFVWFRIRVSGRIRDLDHLLRSSALQFKLLSRHLVGGISERCMSAPKLQVTKTRLTRFVVQTFAPWVGVAQP